MAGQRFVWLWATLSLSLLACSGCAGISYKEASCYSTNGLRYHPPATYVLVKPDYTRGAASVTLISAPDVTRTFAADPYAWFAYNKSTIQFKNGMLEKVESEADGTKLPKTMIEAGVAVGKETLDRIAQGKELALAAAKAGAVAALVNKDKSLSLDERRVLAEKAVTLFYVGPNGLQVVYGSENGVEQTPEAPGGGKPAAEGGKPAIGGEK